MSDTPFEYGLIIIITMGLLACSSKPAAEVENDAAVGDKTLVQPSDHDSPPDNSHLSKPVSIDEVQQKDPIDKPVSAPSLKPQKEVKEEVTHTVMENEEETVVVKKTELSDIKDIKEVIENDERIQKEAVMLKLPDHMPWDALLKRNVTSSGAVDYDGFKEDKDKLKGYIDHLKSLPPQGAWGKNATLTYWINLYNALTVNLILENYPISSIMKINGGKAWDLKVVTVGNKELSLNDIEHNIIRKQFKEPRIHFAVNCAATSCPKLLNEAYIDSKLNAQLEAQAKHFINNTSKNNISSNQLKLSKIFDWYGKDFGDVASYVSKYANMPAEEGTPITFLNYDWSLNK